MLLQETIPCRSVSVDLELFSQTEKPETNCTLLPHLTLNLSSHMYIKNTRQGEGKDGSKESTLENTAMQLEKND